MGLYLSIVSVLEHKNIKINPINSSWRGLLWNKIKFPILTFMLNVSVLYETDLGLAVIDVFQYITNWLLTGKNGLFPWFCITNPNFAILLPWKQMGSKDSKRNKKPLLHNGVWSFLHRDKQAFTAELCCSTALSLQVPWGRDWACLCQCADHGKLLVARPLALSGEWGCTAIQLYHISQRNGSHVRWCPERGWVSPLCPASLAHHHLHRTILGKQTESKSNLTIKWQSLHEEGRLQFSWEQCGWWSSMTVITRKRKPQIPYLSADAHLWRNVAFLGPVCCSGLHTGGLFPHRLVPSPYPWLST